MCELHSNNTHSDPKGFVRYRIKMTELSVKRGFILMCIMFQTKFEQIHSPQSALSEAKTLQRVYRRARRVNIRLTESTKPRLKSRIL